METKKFTVNIDGYVKFLLEFNKKDTVKDIKIPLLNWFAHDNLDPKDYKIQMFINNTTKIPVFNTKEFDNTNLEKVWDKINNPIIIIKTVQSNKAELMNNELLQSLMIAALKMDLKDLVNLCATNTQYKQICDSEWFWQTRFNQDYPHVEDDKIRELGSTWKNRYREMGRYHKIKDAIDIYRQLNDEDKSTMIKLINIENSDGFEPVGNYNDIKSAISNKEKLYIRRGENWSTGIEWGDMPKNPSKIKLDNGVIIYTISYKDRDGNIREFENTLSSYQGNGIWKEHDAYDHSVLIYKKSKLYSDLAYMLSSN